MSNTMKALDEIEGALLQAEMALRQASCQLTEDHRIVLNGRRWGGPAIDRLANALSLLLTLRAALTPPADDEIEAIRARHESVQGNRPHSIDWSEIDGQDAHTDRATLLRALNAERQRRVEVEMAAQIHATWLSEREEWLRREWKNGGDYKHLSTREEECAYIRKRFAKNLPATITKETP